MLRRQAVLFRRWLIAFDVAVTAAVFIVTFHVRQWLAMGQQKPVQLPGWLEAAVMELPAMAPPKSYYLLLLGLLPAWGLALYLSDTANFRVSYRQTAVRYVRAMALGLGFLLAASFFLKLDFVARSFVVLFGTVDVIALIVGRYVMME